MKKNNDPFTQMCACGFTHQFIWNDLLQCYRAWCDHRNGYFVFRKYKLSDLKNGG